MPGVGLAAAVGGVDPRLVPFTTRTGMHKQGAPTVDTVGHTSHHRMEVVADAASAIRARYGFWSWMNTPLAAGTLRVDAALVRGDGTIIPLTFNGGETTLEVTTDGVIVPYVDTDPLDVTVTRGEALYVRTFLRAVGADAPFGATWFSDTGSASWYQTGDHLLDPVGSAPGIPGPAYANTYYAHPIALLGRQSTELPSLLCWGDSNMANADQFSWYERALAKRYPYMRLNSAGQGLGSGGSANVIEQADGTTHAIVAMGTNNFGSTVGVNLPLLQAAIENFRARGVEKVLVCTLPPSTESTDNWATYVNQNPLGGSAPQQQNRVDLNDAIRAMASAPGDSNADAVLDAASYVETDSSGLFTINGQYWRIASSGTAPLYYGTGPHYEERGMAAAAVGGTLAIDRLVTGETGFLQQNPDLGT